MSENEGVQKLENGKESDCKENKSRLPFPWKANLISSRALQMKPTNLNHQQLKEGTEENWSKLFLIPTKLTQTTGPSDKQNFVVGWMRTDSAILQLWKKMPSRTVSKND